MALTKNKMVSEIGRRTRLRNHDVQQVIEALIQVWTEELASGGRIELQNFLVLEVQRIDRGERCPAAKTVGKLCARYCHRTVGRE